MQGGQGSLDSGACGPSGKPPRPHFWTRASGTPAAADAVVVIRSRTGTPSTRASTTSTSHSAQRSVASEQCCRLPLTPDRSSSAPPPAAAGVLIASTPAASDLPCPIQTSPTSGQAAQRYPTEHGDECECVACETHRSFHALLRSSGDTFNSKSSGPGPNAPGRVSPGVRLRGRCREKHGMNTTLDANPVQRVRSRPPCEQDQQRNQQQHRQGRSESERAPSGGDVFVSEFSGSPLQRRRRGENSTCCMEPGVGDMHMMGQNAMRPSLEVSLPSHNVLVDVLESIQRDIESIQKDTVQESPARANHPQPNRTAVDGALEAELQRREAEVAKIEAQVQELARANDRQSKCTAVDEAYVAELHRREAALAEREAKVQEHEQVLNKQSKDLDHRTQELDQRTKELDQRTDKLFRLEKELLQKEAVLNRKQNELNSDIKKQEQILETRNKNLGLNLKRRQAQLEERKKGLNAEALRDLQQQEQELAAKAEEAERIRQKQKEAVEKELEEMKREAEEAVNIQLQEIMRERGEIEKAKRGLTKKAEREMENRKAQIELDLQKQLEAIDSKREELMLREMGVKASVPEYWQNQQLRATPQVKVDWRAGSKMVLDLLQRTCMHANCAGRDGTFVMDHVKKIHVWRIENPILWKQYCAKALELESRHKVQKIKCVPVQPPVPDLWQPSPNMSLNKSLNEVMLWHGTRKETANKIVCDGFDERVCSLSGLFGAGLYFAQDSCKSGQYALKGSDRSHWFLLSRVLLGRPHYATGAMNSLRKAPDGYDSVVYNPIHGGLGGVGHHRELIVYDRFQAYPEFLIQAFT